MGREGVTGSVLAVVPARGGSKEIPLKNLRTVAGKSLVRIAAELIAKVSEIDRAVVSTDHDGIAREAEAHGLSAPFRRPPEFSGDRIADLPVLKHALETMEALEKRRFEFVVMLQPTCPLRTHAQVKECLRLVREEKFDAAWTVSPVSVKFHPLKQLRFEDGRLGYFDQRGAGVVARQELGETFIRNGACYVWRRDALLGEGILPANSTALVVREKLVNIDSLEDLAAAERLLGHSG